MVRFIRRLCRALILCLPPATAGILLHVMPDLPGLRMFALMACAYSALAVLVFVLTWRSRVETRAMAEAVAGLEHSLWKQRMELQTQIEVLCAEREIGLILREDVDFRAVRDRALGVVARLLGGRCAIEIHVAGQLRAVWADGKAWFDRGMVKRAKVPAAPAVSEAGGRVEPWKLEVPLSYDGEQTGRAVLRAEMDEERGRQLRAHAEEIAGFIALALKTPDLYTRAVEDGLTGLATKRHFLNQIDVLVEQARRDGAPLSLVMVDIDHFKKINDRHGHLTGDKVLKGVADALKRCIRTRAGDSAGFRYGGEELSILLPRVPLAKAAAIAERVREAIEAKPVSGVPVTASLGVAQFDERTMAAPEALIARADAALYRAKEGGRNRVVAA